MSPLPFSIIDIHHYFNLYVCLSLRYTYGICHLSSFFHVCSSSCLISHHTTAIASTQGDLVKNIPSGYELAKINNFDTLLKFLCAVLCSMGKEWTWRGNDTRPLKQIFDKSVIKPSKIELFTASILRQIHNSMIKCESSSFII